MKENFLVNPPKHKRSSKKRRHAKRRHNPIGESLMIAGLNPFRRHKARRNDPTWFGHRKGHRKAAKRRFNPAKALSVKGILGFNPLSTDINLYTTVGSGILVAATPRLIGPMINWGKSGWQKYVVEAAATLGGAFLLTFTPAKKIHATSWAVGGSIAILGEILKEYILPIIPGGSALKGYEDYTVGTPAYGPGYSSVQGLEDYKVLGDTGDFGAFPDTHLGAFPDISSSDYSYDRNLDSFVEYGLGQPTSVKGW